MRGWGIVSGLVMLLLTGCGAKTTATQQLNWGEKAPLQTIDPAKVADVVSSTTVNNLDEGLFRIGQNAKVKPGVAQHYKVSADGKTWTFQLRKTAKWSNGDPVTARDFVYGWRRTVTPATKSQYGYLFDHVANATAITAGKKRPSQLGIKAVGQRKLVVTLTRAQPYFKTLLGTAAFFPQHQATVAKYGRKYATRANRAVYNGPFKLVKWTGTGKQWTLQRNPKYWNAKAVRLHRVNVSVMSDQRTWLNQYQAGKVDAVTLDGTQYAQYRNSKDVYLRRGAATFFLEMQQRHGLLKQRRARQALSLAINRRELVKNVLADGSAVPAGFIPRGLMRYRGTDFAAASRVPQATATNLTKARQLWRQALKASGQSHVTLSLLADDTPVGKATAEFLQSELERLPGLTVKPVTVPFNVRLSRSQAGQFDLLVNGWIANVPDASSFSNLMTTTNSYNHGGWSNAVYDQAVKQADVQDANRPAARWRDLVTAEKQLMTDQGVIPLYQRVQAQLVRPRVKGLVYFPLGAQWDFSESVIAQK